MAKTNQQIIVTEGDFGVEILTQFIDTNKKPVPIEGCSCKVKFSYDGNVITEKTGVVIDEPKGIVSIILDKEETQYSGLWTSYWICYDQFNNVTTTENIYYYVQPAIGSVNNPAFTELLNYYNRDEVNDMFKNILEQLNNYTLSKDDVEEYIKIYAQDKIDDDFVRQCILDAIGNGSDYAKKKDVEKINSQLTNDIETINSQLDKKVNKKDLIYLSDFKDGETSTDRLQNAINYTAKNFLKLYIDESVTLTRTIILPSNSQIYSNPRKYVITTNVGTLDDGMTLFESYGKSKILVDGVKFQNKGYGTSGSMGTLGLFDGFGAGLCFGGCYNVTVKNCEFFMCGGYRYYEGCGQLWFSCCQNVLAEGNICELGDNGIIVDRWVQSNPNVTQKYNSGVIITNNRITNMSGRCIGLESVYGNGEYVVSNNYCASFGVAAIQGDGFDNATITGNVINGDISLRINPKTRYGLSLPGWDWTEQIKTTNHVGILASWCDNGVLISGNNICNVKHGIESVGTIDLNVISNTIKSVDKGVYCRTHDTKTTNCKNISILSNNIRDIETFGILLDNENGLGNFANIMLSNNHIHTNKIGIKLIKANDSHISSNRIKGLSNVQDYSDEKVAIQIISSNNTSIFGNYVSNHCVYLFMKEASMILCNDNVRNIINCFKVADNSSANNLYVQGFYTGITNVCAGSGTISGDGREAFIFNVSSTHHSQVGHKLLQTIRRSDTNLNGLACKGDVIINTDISSSDSAYKWICTSEIGEAKTWKTV